MKSVLIPHLEQAVTVLSPEVLADGYAASLWESEQLLLVLGIDATENKWVVDWVNIAVQEGCGEGISPCAQH